MLRLNLGCSDDFIKGWLNVDVADPKVPEGIEYQQVDLNQRWPWLGSSVDEIKAFDVFEHIRGFNERYYHGTMASQRTGKTHVMNEAHRVLKPGGILHMTVPSVDRLDGKVNRGAFADPTHVSYWTWDDIFYFSEQFNHERVRGTYSGAAEAGERLRLGPAYGITALFQFPEVEQDVFGSWKVVRQPSGEWSVVAQAGGTRAKLVGRLTAVK